MQIKDLKISYFSSFYDNSPIAISVDKLVDIALNDQDVKKHTEGYRHCKAQCANNELPGAEIAKAKKQAEKQKSNLPVFIPGALCEYGKNRENIKALLPACGGDIDHVLETKIPEIMECLRNDEHVVFASLSPSGKGIRFVCNIEGIEVLQRMWDEASASARTNLYKYAYKQVADYFETLTGVRMDEKCANPEHAFTIAHDPDVYFNPSATPFKIDMSGFKMPSKGRPKKNDANAKAATKKDSRNVLTYVLGKLTCKGESPENGRNDFLYKLSSMCNRHGMDKEELKAWAIGEMADVDFNEQEITRTIESAYSHIEEFGTEAIDSGIIDKIRELMYELADYRFNLTTNRMEIRFHEEKIDIKSEYGWEEMGERHLKTVYTYVKSYVKTNMTDVDVVLYSFGFASDYHPMLAYIQDYEPWDPSKKDHIEDMFNHIRLVREDLRPRLYYYFRMWFIRFVAMAIGRTDKNQLVPALIGKENTGKSYTWEVLLPPELSKYYQRVDANEEINKDFVIMLSEKYVINLDERSVDKRISNTMKSIITGGAKNVRRPYGRHSEQIKQCGSLVMTSNDMQYIAISDGNRRYLSIEVESTLDYNDHPIDYAGLYAQAYYLINHGELRNQLTKEETAELKAINKAYTEPDVCEDAILTYFEIPGPHASVDVKWYTNTQICETIWRSFSRDDVTAKAVGAKLRELDVLSKKRHGQPLYRLVLRKYDAVLAPDVEEEQVLPL